MAGTEVILFRPFSFYVDYKEIPCHMYSFCISVFYSYDSIQRR